MTDRGSKFLKRLWRKYLDVLDCPKYSFLWNKYFTLTIFPYYYRIRKSPKNLEILNWKDLIYFFVARLFQTVDDQSCRAVLVPVGPKDHTLRSTVHFSSFSTLINFIHIFRLSQFQPYAFLYYILNFCCVPKPGFLPSFRITPSIELSIFLADCSFVMVIFGHYERFCTEIFTF